MNRKPIQVILIIAISLAIPVLSAFVSYYAVASADFLASNLGYEAFDQDYLSVVHQSELRTLDSSNFIKTVRLEIFPFGLFPRFSSEISCLDQKTLVLRC